MNAMMLKSERAAKVLMNKLDREFEANLFEGNEEEHGRLTDILKHLESECSVKGWNVRSYYLKCMRMSGI